ncbi:MAG: hypothetical protein AVDCRST_MAG85-3232 [uncultured Solirubrobacteraceae bacterium]|uniref:Glycosyltransferase 2-like domain-containing protein n=1 Tax=uncultured Solirubrobacteraceae bacterium TaxID=1162706 RepID=A0A6J4TM11_9ACTN|nr:MAG: hypothetical protein AVDCRST_MAG85-3232 [uncultured Solirubrobacteraceae bacterium]
MQTTARVATGGTVLKPLPLSYILPLRWTDDAELDDLTAYLGGLAPLVDEVIVVDGSPEPLFATHRDAWSRHVTHVAPDPRLDFVMGKVNGVDTGVRMARNEGVIIADDDVRYGRPELAQMVEALERSHLVRPHNVFAPRPWHARWDTGRILLNRAVNGDYPGTLGVRASCYRAIDGYDGDVMFENLELIRSVEAAGGVVTTAFDILVERRPPTTSHFLGQRVRQAYDDFTLPPRMALFLSVAPAVALAAVKRRPQLIVAGAAAAVAVAERGRRRAGAARAFERFAALAAPLWVSERAVTAWLAVGQRLFRGGTTYGETTIARSATPPRELRARLAGLAPPLTPLQATDPVKADREAVAA